MTYEEYSELRKNKQTIEEFADKEKQSITTSYSVSEPYPKKACINYIYPDSNEPRYLLGNPILPRYKTCEHFNDCKETDCECYSKYSSFSIHCNEIDKINSRIKQIPFLQRVCFWYKFNKEQQKGN